MNAVITEYVDRNTNRPLRHAWGVGLRRPHFDEFVDRARDVDVVEVLAENFMSFGGKAAAVLDAVCARFPVVVHGLGVSIAGPAPLRTDYLRALRDFAHRCKTPWISDHLTYSAGPTRQYHDLIPFPYNKASLQRVCDRVRQVQDAVGLPFLLENSSYYASFSCSTMTEAAFFCELVARTGCGLLLDINNVYVNATNHGYDPYAFIDALPHEAVWQFHMAGHDASGPFLVDTHGASAPDPVMELYAYALGRVGPVWTIFEWDNHIPPFDRLLEENDKVRAAGRAAMAREGGAAPVPAAREPSPLEVTEAEQRDLENAYAIWDAVLSGTLSPEEGARRLGADPERVAIYPRFVFGHVRTVLEKNFPATAALVGEPVWTALVRGFFDACPSQSEEMNETARPFPAFVESVADRWNLPPLAAELAALEWASFEAYKMPVEMAGRWNPTARILHSEHGAGSWWRAWRSGRKPDETGLEDVVVFRHPGDHLVYTYVVTPQLAFALKVAHDDMPLQEAAQEAGIDANTAGALWERAVAIGLVLV